MRPAYLVSPFLAVALLAVPSAASAHAFPEAEQPAADSTLASPPAQVSIEFDAPIESLFSKLDVIDSAGHNHDQGKPRVEGSRRTLTVKLKPLKPGDYTVRWSVVAEDGHRTEGSYIFTVKSGP
jgi:copper resistance protein C